MFHMNGNKFNYLAHDRFFICIRRRGNKAVEIPLYRSRRKPSSSLGKYTCVSRLLRVIKV